MQTVSALGGAPAGQTGHLTERRENLNFGKIVCRFSWTSLNDSNWILLNLFKKWKTVKFFKFLIYEIETPFFDLLKKIWKSAQGMRRVYVRPDIRPEILHIE